MLGCATERGIPMTNAAHQSVAAELRSSEEARLACRRGEFTGSTAGLAPGHVQCNLAILTQDLAADFLRFCQLNPKPCPLVGVSEIGDPCLPGLGVNLDVRTDLPAYRVWQHGELVEETTDISKWWRPDLVAFALGCSYSFESALVEEGLPIRHIDCGLRVPMYRTNIECVQAGPFAGPMVVSMRPFKPAHAIRAIQITSRFPALHGAPIHVGLPELIGIRQLARPDYGDPIILAADELPVFWACGVTPQAVIAATKPPFALTHAPGAMLVTDLMNRQFAVL
jgi:uncharacterized protein YcsI (UPF0317 family)